MILSPMLATKAPASPFTGLPEDLGAGTLESLLRIMRWPGQKPEILQQLVAYILDPTFALEEKMDGDRVLVAVVSGVPTVYGRDGQSSQYTGLFRDKAHMALFAGLPETVLLDGELIGSTLWVFDLPEVDGRGFHSASTAPFLVRRRRLEVLFDLWSPPPALFRPVPWAASVAGKAALVIDCLSNHAEGLMAKKLTSIYRPGRSRSEWLKIKFEQDFDAFVSALGVEGKANAMVSVHRDGRVFDVGTVSTNGKGPLAVGDVVEVRYARWSEAERLVHPRIMRRRTDKAASECTFDQLVG